MADPVLVAKANRAQDLLGQFGDWIDRYRGGVPRAFAAVIMMWESDGNFDAAGDPSLGERGYYQIAAYVPVMFGLPVEATADPESNVCLGLLEYQYEACLWHIFSGGLVSLGSADSYRLARLTFAIGRGGARTLAMSAGMRTDDDVYGDISRFVAASGAPSLGGVSAAKVAQRTLDIQTQWAIAELVQGGNTPGPPTLVPDPPAGPYTIPADAAALFSEPLGTGVLLLGIALGVGAFFFARSRSKRKA